MTIALLAGAVDLATIRATLNQLIEEVNAMGGGAAPAAADLLGSDGSAFTGITLGTNLSFTGATLNAAGGGGTPASPDTSLQFNDSGAFGGSSFNYVADQIVATVSHSSVIGAAIANAGTGGTPGAATVIGSTGTGTKFQASVTIEAGGTIESVDSISVAGSYTVPPTAPTAEPVTGGGLTGAELNLALSYTPSVVGSAPTRGFGFGTNGFPELAGGNAGVTARLSTTGGVNLNNKGWQILFTNQYSGLSIGPELGTAGESYVSLEGYDVGNYPFIATYFARGVAGAPSALQSGDQFFQLSPLARATSQFVSPINVDAFVEENLDDTHYAGSLWISSRGLDQSYARRLGVDGSGNTNILSGGLVVGTPTGGSQGAGSINVEHLFINGVEITP